MADTTKIEWTDATWNPVTGCSVVSPGCTNCYAMQLAGTRLKNHASRAGLTRESGGRPKWTGEVRFNEQWLDQPLRWRKPRRIFVCAHGDLFHENVPDKWIDRIFAVMALCPQHTFQVLTKRAGRMREYCSDNLAVRVQNAVDNLEPDGFWKFPGHEPWVISDFDRDGGQDRLPNVWLGVSVEDQQRADERIPDLLATPAAIRFLSCEPLLGPIDLRQWLNDYGCSACGYGGPVDERCIQCGWRGANSHQAGPCPSCGEILQDDYACPECGEPDGEGDFGPTISGPRLGLLDWIIAGGESGNGARPMHPDWARSLRDQCAVAGVPFFFKQWGEFKPWPLTADEFFHPEPQHEGELVIGPEGCLLGNPHAADFQVMRRVGKKAAGRTLDGGTHDGMPA